jgi:hypothetical protein
MNKEDYQFWSAIIAVFVIIILIAMVALWSIATGDGIVSFFIVTVYSAIILVFGIFKIIEHFYNK